MKLTDYWTDKLMRSPADEGAPAAPDGEPVTPEGEGGGSPSAAPDLSWMPETYVKDGNPDIEAFRARYDELESEAAARQEALAGVPEAPDGYEIAAPEIDFGDLDLPEGFKFEIDTGEDIQPLYGEMQGLLHKYQMPKEAMGEMLGLLGKYQATLTAREFSAVKADMETLGPNGKSRVEHVSRLLDNRLPKEMADALRGATGTAMGVKAMEKLLTPRTVQSPSPTPQGVDVDALNPRERHKLAVAQATNGRRA